MNWELADYREHPIDGVASQIEACATHLGTVAGDIRGQISQLRAINTGELWESAHGAHEAFQDVVDDLPDKLDLVANRYEAIAAALNAFHPALSSTKADAEYNIQQAEAAQAEVERAEAGVEAMESFEDQARRDADNYNDNREDGEAERQPDQWTGENYRDTLATAQADLARYIQAVRDAVEAFNRAAETCEDALHEAGNDALKNDSGLGAALGRALSSLGNFLLEALDLVLDILEWIAIAIAIVIIVIVIVGLFVSGVGAPAGLLVAALVVNGLILGGSIISAAAGGRRDWGDVGWAAVNTAVSGLGVAGAFGKFGALGRLFSGPQGTAVFGDYLGAFLLGRDLGSKGAEVMAGDSQLLNTLGVGGTGALGIVIPPLQIPAALGALANANQSGTYDAFPSGLSTSDGLNAALGAVPLIGEAGSLLPDIVPPDIDLDSVGIDPIVIDLPPVPPMDSVVISLPGVPAGGGG